MIMSLLRSLRTVVMTVTVLFVAVASGEGLPYPTVKGFIVAGDTPSYRMCPGGMVGIAEIDAGPVRGRFLVAFITKRFVWIDFVAGRVVMGTVDDDERLTVTTTMATDEARERYPSPCDYLAPAAPI